MPMEFVSLDEFHRSKLQPGEVVLIFVHELKKAVTHSTPASSWLVNLPENINNQLSGTSEVQLWTYVFSHVDF